MWRVMVFAFVVGAAVVAWAADNEPPEGFTALFNGKDLTGWGTREGKEASGQQVAQWKVADGIIQYTGKDGDLWTRKSFKDFVLMAECRLAATTNTTGRADTGIYLRGYPKCQVNIWDNPIGSGGVYGYRVDRDLGDEAQKAATPARKADKKVGEWNAFVITIKGDRVSVELNGEKVIDNLQLPGCPAEGPIGLQNHNTPVEFRNIYIKELKAE